MTNFGFKYMLSGKNCQITSQFTFNVLIIQKVLDPGQGH